MQSRSLRCDDYKRSLRKKEEGIKKLLNFPLSLVRVSLKSTTVWAEIHTSFRDHCFAITLPEHRDTYDDKHHPQVIPRLQLTQVILPGPFYEDEKTVEKGPHD
jgi:hypothetical protein